MASYPKTPAWSWRCSLPTVYCSNTNPIKCLLLSKFVHFSFYLECYIVLGLGRKVPFITVRWFSKTCTNSKNKFEAENLQVLVGLRPDRISKEISLKPTRPTSPRLILGLWRMNKKENARRPISESASHLVLSNRSFLPLKVLLFFSYFLLLSLRSLLTVITISNLFKCKTHCANMYFFVTAIGNSFLVVIWLWGGRREKPLGLWSNSGNTTEKEVGKEIPGWILRHIIISSFLSLACSLFLSSYHYLTQWNILTPC